VGSQAFRSHASARGEDHRVCEAAALSRCHDPGGGKRFEHDHFFDETEDGTTMRDVIVFESPLGRIGRIVDALVLSSYLKRLITERNQLIKSTAERAR
jgi:ligand-binding SRPBCC domain-containing protein